MRRSLLDVNVLIAMMDPLHTHHAHARSWFEEQRSAGWASCPLTENGFVRVISQPTYARPLPPAVAIQALRHATTTELHEFWPCDHSIVDPAFLDDMRVLGPKTVTDAYLLALAAERNGRLVTFDRRISLAAAPAATEANLLVL